MLTGIIFVLRTGIGWEYLPQEMGCGCGLKGQADVKMYSRHVDGYDWLDHLYLLWEDGRGAQTVFEGGPEYGSGPGVFNTLFGDYGRLGAGYGDVGEHKVDSEPSVVLMVGQAALHKYDCLVSTQRIIVSWNIEYNPLGPNSNWVAHAFCTECSIPFRFPEGSNPFGWWRNPSPPSPLFF